MKMVEVDLNTLRNQLGLGISTQIRKVRGDRIFIVVARFDEVIGKI